ncbi:hypothetical protein BP6252_13516 [Coleophoma cylindrospora]|uniref:5'-deoxynucleotidase n=1 Tax=Coleophoma cylindrospora TaxID=1849047 RepID=A0A3D8Q8E1_9HELO|nr:hypothetical protein BP6252_13516 [Coleophoma cylindrospora]
MGSNGDTVPPVLKGSTAQDQPWTVEGVVAALPGGPPQTDSESPVPFFHMIERLKTTKREGWRRFGIETGESIADHMYRMSLITMCAPPSLTAKLDIPRCTRMALIHDVAEALVGDITPVDGVPKPEKNRRESTTMDYLTGPGGLLGRVNGGLNGKEIKAIWQEYEDGVTEESKFVHDVDKIELVLQMVEYERMGHGKYDLGEFSWVASRIEMPEVKAWADEVLQERATFWAELGEKKAGLEKPEEGLVKQQNEYYGSGKA